MLLQAVKPLEIGAESMSTSYLAFFKNCMGDYPEPEGYEDLDMGGAVAKYEAALSQATGELGVPSLQSFFVDEDEATDEGPWFDTDNALVSLRKLLDTCRRKVTVSVDGFNRILANENSLKDLESDLDYFEKLLSWGQTEGEQFRFEIG